MMVMWVPVQTSAPWVGLEPTTNGLTGRSQETVCLHPNPLVTIQRMVTVMHCSDEQITHQPWTHTCVVPPAS